MNPSTAPRRTPVTARFLSAPGLWSVGSVKGMSVLSLGLCGIAKVDDMMKGCARLRYPRSYVSVLRAVASSGLMGDSQKDAVYR